MTDESSSKLWGGRFSKDLDASLDAWGESTTLDSRMVDEDLWGSQAHVAMLGRQSIIPMSDAAAILKELLKLQDSYLAGGWQLETQHEDVHMNVEHRVIGALGLEIGGKMHTARSRNDQIPLDIKLHLRRQLHKLRRDICSLLELFLARAEENTDAVMVSYTHTQHAQPISVAFWLSHYGAALLRDLDRLGRAHDLVDCNPLGAAAIAGTSFPTDRELTTRLLGFQKLQVHALDATSSGDFALETVSALAILMTTVGRLAEELILWSSYEFRTVILDDAFATGSSIMPQKKNPSVVELLRGRAARMNGILVSAFSIFKGLPSGYNRDVNEVKRVLWEALDLTQASMEFLPGVISSTKFDTTRMEQLAYDNFATATHLANYLVEHHQVPFRKAHHVVGSLVGLLVRQHMTMANQQVCLDFLLDEGISISASELEQIVTPSQVMRSAQSLGGTSPESVESMLKQMTSKLHEHRQAIEIDFRRAAVAYDTCRSIARNVSAGTDAAAFDRMLDELAD